MWVTYRCHLKTLEKFHLRCLRKILCIRWEDRGTNANVLVEDNTTSIETMVMQLQVATVSSLSQHIYTRQQQTVRQTFYFTRRRNGLGERRGRCLYIFTSPSIWHLQPTLQQDLQIKNLALESLQDTNRPLEDVILVSRNR